MPNWCNNTLTISHNDPAMIQRMIDHKDAPLQEFIPCPHDPETSSEWYNWRIENWGTKWDIELQNLQHIDTNEISATFDSAWSPPLAAYNALTAMGFRISAFYSEMGMGFAGRFESDEEGAIHTEETRIDFADENWRDEMSDEMADFLENEYQDWLEYMKDDEQ